MAMFTSFGRRRPDSPAEEAARGLPDVIRQQLPDRFEAVGEALASAADTRPACAVVGRDVARDGAALGEALAGLRTTFLDVLGMEPDFASVEALSVAWSEATLEFLHGVSCEDPLTGLASRAHLRAKLDEVYREADQVGEKVPLTHAVVLVELSAAGHPGADEHRFTRAMQLVKVTETVRAVFAGGETIARLRADRAAVVVRRRPELGASVGMLRELLSGTERGATDVRLWIEGLPQSVAAARTLLDELAR